MKNKALSLCMVVALLMLTFTAVPVSALTEGDYTYEVTLKNLAVTVNRQKVIGKYIADFYIATSKIVIELDGSQHYDDSGVENDAKRDAFFNSLDIKVLRYSNLDVCRNFEGVCQDIQKHVDTSSVTS